LSEEAPPETFAKPVYLDNLKSVIPSQESTCAGIHDGLGEEEEIKGTHNWGRA